jgi:hypothetical protein
VRSGEFTGIRRKAVGSKRWEVCAPNPLTKLVVEKDFNTATIRVVNEKK